MTSQVGFVLFEDDGFKGAGGTDEDYRGGSTTVTSYSGDEAKEESWIDSNGQQFLVNRFNGSLIRARAGS